MGEDVVDAEGLKAVGALGEWSGGLFERFGTGCKFAARYGGDVAGKVRWTQGIGGVKGGG